MDEHEDNRRNAHGKFVFPLDVLDLGRIAVKVQAAFADADGA